MGLFSLERDEKPEKAKQGESMTKNPSWIRRNFFQICVVLLLAWIGWNLELVVDSYDYSSQNFMEDIMASELETDFYVP